MDTKHVKTDTELLGNCGDNIRNDSRTRELYYRIKDERNQARTEERATSPQDNLKISSSWDSVSNLGLQIIYSESKDIEILAWLSEANLRLRGFSGLREIYELCNDLFYNHWDSLRSISDDNDEEKFAPFAGLNGIGTEGTLVQPLRLTPLIPGGKFGEHSLWDFQLAQRPTESKRREELYRLASEAGVAAMSSHLAEVTACLSSFDAIMAVLSERCGQFAPPSSNIRNTLIEAAAAIRTLGGREKEPAPVEQAAAAVADTDEGGQPAVRISAASPEGISSRDEAFETLLSVARYFRRTEPHSPISLSIETLVRRGRMDFSELLAELLPETQARNAVLTAAGIKPGGENGK
ncbi:MULTISPECIES: type VI secretion system protein TssA [unclassified Agrobacterium]|uniref:type VI secretion system protein TssA n=1 Tax=unclassified Agrobacterium TaxID=2632611 RepID=UPI0009DBC3E3|nr:MULTISPECIES: type VI secretion system protein TssA [unclassified Agrobacterium]SNB74833.1 type VI secretion system protein ImpA [Agrobacterium sp. 719_389]